MKTTSVPVHSTARIVAKALTTLALVASACSLTPWANNESFLSEPQAVKLPTHEPSPTSAATLTAIPTPTPTELPTGNMLLHQTYVNGHSQLHLLDIDYGTQYQLASAGEDQSYPSWTPDGRSIVYLSASGSNSEIHMMAWDGSGDNKLSRERAAQEYVPVVSPDGTRIAFFAAYPGHWALFIMNSDGSDSHPITDNTVFESAVSWSPDGRSLAFTPWHNTEAPPFIASVGSDGEDYIELTRRDDVDRDPVYSPDGTQIAYNCHERGMPQICIMTPDGSARVQLTTGPGGNDGPVWSPDGSQIAFVSWRDSADPDHCQDGDCNFEVYVMDSDGSDQTNLSSNPAEDWYPAWSPDGSRIAFVSLRDEPAHPSECGDTCNSEIYIMARNGENQVRITDNGVPDWNPIWRPPVSAAAAPAIAAPTPEPTRAPIGGGSNQIAYWAQSDTGIDIYLVDLLRHADNTETIAQGESPAWSPDGSQIVFADLTSMDQSQLFTMNADGSSRRQITFSNTSSSDPAWSPDGKEIAFALDRRSIHIYDLRSASERAILEGPDDYYFPAWSPDAQELAFLANSGELASTLMVATSEGSDIRVVANVADWSSPPAWSPDGEWIAYGCFEDQWQVCKINSQGGVPQVLTHASSNGSPSWSPDGQWITFISYRDDNWEVYVMRADGSDQQRITNDWLQNFGPVWRP